MIKIKKEKIITFIKKGKDKVVNTTKKEFNKISNNINFLNKCNRFIVIDELTGMKTDSFLAFKENNYLYLKKTHYESIKDKLIKDNIIMKKANCEMFKIANIKNKEEICNIECRVIEIEKITIF